MNKEQKTILSDTEVLVPEIRFPEFEKEGNWRIRKFNEIGEFIGGGTPSTSNPKYWNGNIQWYTPTEVKNGVLHKSVRTITNLGLKKSSAKLLPVGTILLTTRATIGDVAITTEECSTNQGFQSLIVYDSEVNLFWYYWIINNRNELIKRATGSTFKEIGKNDIKAIKTLSPVRIKEQQKIANCLSSLDDVINAETEKLELLQDHKKGLLQHLFPQQDNVTLSGVEGQPKYRFPEFKDDGDWVIKELSVALKVKSSQIAKNKLEMIEKGFAVYGADGMLGFIDSYALEKDYIAIVKDGSGVGNIFYCEGKSSLLGTLNYLIPKNEQEYKLKWLYYLLQTITFKPFIKGSGIPHIYFKDYSKLLVSYPKPTEQQKISDCLSSVDELIESQKQKIEGLKAHKKGLLQQLFPKILN